MPFGSIRWWRRYKPCARSSENVSEVQETRHFALDSVVKMLKNMLGTALVLQQTNGKHVKLSEGFTSFQVPDELLAPVSMSQAI